MSIKKEPGVTSLKISFKHYATAGTNLLGYIYPHKGRGDENI